MMKVERFISFIFLSVFMFTSCERDIIYSDEKKIEKGIWDINDTVILNASISDLEKDFNVFINIDVDEFFLTNNLWLFISTQSPSGNIESDTIMFYVADEKGKWFGKKIRSVISNKFLYKQHIRFPERGKYIFNIRHGMREEDLPKIRSVGVSIEKTESFENTNN